MCGMKDKVSTGERFLKEIELQCVYKNSPEIFSGTRGFRIRGYLTVKQA